MDTRISLKYLLCFVTLLCFLILSVSGQNCRKVNSCKCKQDDGKVLDLSPLSNSNGPRFSDVLDINQQDRFSYNPCKPFTEGTCSNVAVCQLRPDPSQPGVFYYYNAGNQDSATFSWDDTNNIYTIQYSADSFYLKDGNNSKGDSGEFVLRTTTLNLVCDKSQEASFTAVGEFGESAYVLVLNSKHACLGSEALSAGTILIIIFVCVLFVYLVGGVIFQIFIKKNSGKKVIPNYDFWAGFPGLVKDGVFFIGRICKGKGSYSNISK